MAFAASSLDNVGEGIVFSGCPVGTFVRLPVLPVRYCYHDIS